MEKEEQRLVTKFLWLKGWCAERIHEELMSTLGDDSYAVSRIKIWLQKFSKGDLSCKDSPRPGQPLLTLGPQLEAFMQKCPFASTKVIAQHFFTTVPTIKDSLQRELGMRKFLRRWVPHFLSSARKVADIEASKTILRVLQDAESNDCKGIATSDESWFRYCHLQHCLRGRHPRLFQGRGKQLARKNNDNDFLHCTLTNPIG
jgi:hypothetical protein